MYSHTIRNGFYYINKNGRYIGNYDIDSGSMMFTDLSCLTVPEMEELINYIKTLS